MQLFATYDKSIFDDAKQFLYDEIKNRLIQEGRSALEDARLTKTYLNQTWDLVNAYGFGVVMYGELVHLEVPADSTHSHVIKETTSTIESVARGFEGIGLILANGKEYASYVEAKGCLVMTDSAMRARDGLK